MDKTDCVIRCVRKRDMKIICLCADDVVTEIVDGDDLAVDLFWEDNSFYNVKFSGSQDQIDLIVNFYNTEDEEMVSERGIS